MNIPDFNRYGALGYKLLFKNSIAQDMTKESGLSDGKLVTYIDNQVLSLYNSTLNKIILESRDKRLQELANYMLSLKAHPLQLTRDISLANTSITEITETVFNSVHKIVLPTISTKALLKTLALRCLKKIKR